MMDGRGVEAVEGLLQRMQLLEAERRQVQTRGMKRLNIVVHHALGKLLSKKLAHPDAFERALEKVWCPIRGTECRSLGDNNFLITFIQAMGKQKALKERPGSFSNELLVIMANMDHKKSIDEVEFNAVPIWICITKLRIGLFTKEAT
ncbi:hypothetical protein Zm00014a_040929 [Zea mays]|uniref:Uncharacterized protein n=1 Tax=Zea mays TaxID=4577 RepID=A0A3L6E746_MAIZE|nr:hypothetical protein Zm00014a_040929 [Zea mays]